MNNVLDKLKATLQLAKRYVWALLLAAYPFADQLIGMAETNLPALAPYLGANTFRYMGVTIVAAKLGVQLYRGWLQVRQFFVLPADTDHG